MIARSGSDLAADRAHMVRALDRVRGYLEAHANGSAATAQPDLADDSALARLRGVFGLSRFERDVLLLAAAPELDGTFATLFAQASGDAARAYPTLSLALAALPEPAWSAVTPDAPLRHWRLVQIDGPSVVTGVLRADEAIVNTLLGFAHHDSRLEPYSSDLLGDSSILSAEQNAVASAVVSLWSRNDRAHVQLVCPDRLLARAVTRRVAESTGVAPLVLRHASMPLDPGDLLAVLRACERDVLIRGGFAVLECDDGDDPHRRRTIELIVERFGPALLVLAPSRVHLSQEGVVTLDVTRPTRDEQSAYWEASLGADGADAAGRRLAAQFDLDLATIGTVAASVAPDATADDVWDAVRAQARPQLDALAERIESPARRSDLVLAPDRRRLLRQIVHHVRYRDLVYHRWGFADSVSGESGLTVLFSGASGTGKSLAARVLANELRLDLYRVDLSAVFSKYIGETEKNLRQIFDAAESGGVVLLFDEADALFGKRSEVSDSHDRHANVEVSYLLQRLERFNGVAILTTNMREAFDAAFMRRFRFVVEFPFPDAVLRQRIWRRTFPAATPTDGLDFALLAKLAIPGGNIRNIALNATVRAAARAAGAVGMEDVAAAVRVEYAKLDRSMHDPDLTRWLEAVPQRDVVRAS